MRGACGALCSTLKCQPHAMPAGLTGCHTRDVEVKQGLKVGSGCPTPASVPAALAVKPLRGRKERAAAIMW